MWLTGADDTSRPAGGYIRRVKPPPPFPLPRFGSRTAWLWALSIVAVAAVNGAGLLGIASARRASRDGATRLFEAETQAKGKALERVLEDTRSNLEFLAASSALGRLSHGAGPSALGDREAAEGALLVFLRSHPETVRLTLRSDRGAPLMLMGRRGGVPVLWVSASPTGEEGAAIDPSRPRLTTSVPLHDDGDPAGPKGRLETELAPTLLLGHADPGRSCLLKDARGTPLAGHLASNLEPTLLASVSLEAPGWSAPSPFTVACAEPESQAVALVEPVAARSRATLFLNLAAMVLVVVLGALAIRERARRERTEAHAHEEVRVRELERQLFHAERLTTVGRLAAGIAHEINNPLEGMANYLSLAKDDLARGDVSQVARRLDGVTQGLDRAAGVVRQVLAHADPATAPKTPVDLGFIVAETMEFMRSRSEFADIVFETGLAKEPLVALGSGIMLGQVVSNLVINAAEAQPRGGEVITSSRKEGGRVVVDVADRGPGVAEADRQRVFEPFFSTKDSTGLGLSVCHSIVREHGGELLVLARPGGGAVFRMSLPAHREVSA
jgi:signal transduction histidine kinase